MTFKDRYYKIEPDGTGENKGKNKVNDNDYMIAELLEELTIEIRKSRLSK